MKNAVPNKYLNGTNEVVGDIKYLHAKQENVSTHSLFLQPHCVYNCALAYYSDSNLRELNFHVVSTQQQNN